MDKSISKRYESVLLFLSSVFTIICLCLSCFCIIFAGIDNNTQYHTMKEQILQQFAIMDGSYRLEPLHIGIINDSYVVRAEDKDAPSYFLQRINHHIFENVDGLQHNIQKVTEHIRQKLLAAGVEDVDRRVLRLVPTRDGKLYYKATPELDGTSDVEYWRIYLLITDSHSQDQVTPYSAELAGEAFGTFQCQLSDLPSTELVESIPNFHNIEFRLQQLHEAVAADKVGRLSATHDILSALVSREQEMCLAEELHRAGKLPKRINHCDTKVNNMLFDADGKPLCIVDLDTVMPGYVLSDFGDFMRSAANTGAEDDKCLDNIHVNMDIFRSYARGYLRRATFLTDTERSLLPFGCRLLSYMQTVRFYTDYLNGDTYYKTSYAEHNLVRSRAQLRLLEEQEKVSHEMEQVISSL